jgi:hypothetical protein
LATRHPPSLGSPWFRMDLNNKKGFIDTIRQDFTFANSKTQTLSGVRIKGSFGRVCKVCRIVVDSLGTNYSLKFTNYNLQITNCSLGTYYSDLFFKARSGVDVKITIFCDYPQFSAKNFAFFGVEINVYDQLLWHKLAEF